MLLCHPSNVLILQILAFVHVCLRVTECSSFKTSSTAAINEEEKRMPFALIAARIQPFEFPTYNPPQWADELVGSTSRIPTMQS